jgi:hypothetical protein
MIYTLYRIIARADPTVLDFRSHMAQCQSRRFAEIQDHALWAGVSTFLNPLRAAARARRFSALGTHLARLEVPDDDPGVVVRQTLDPRSAHFTVWACEDLLLTFVREITPISARSVVE